MLAIAQANTIQFVDNGSGVSNGSVYVGPYDLLNDGQAIKGTCFTDDLQVAPPYIWDASVYRVTDFSEPERKKLLEAEWLNQQFAVNTDWEGIHEGIWDIFGASYASANALLWKPRAEANYGTVSWDSFYVLVPSPARLTQSFLVETAAPEAASGGLTAIGYLFVILAIIRRKVMR